MSRLFFLGSILILAMMLAGCPSKPAPNVTENGNTARPSINGNAANSPTPGNSGIVTTVKTPAPTTNDAPTLKPVFLAYCDAKTKGDEAAIRKVYSSETLKLFEADMKAEGTKSLVKYLEIDKVSNKLCEIRNEKINGDTATAEIKTEGSPNGIEIVFERENGEWKLTNKFPDFDSVKKSASGNK